MDTQFFENRDRPVAGPYQELVAYGMNPPAFEWPGGNRVAVQVVVNYEEGSEKSFPMGDGRNDGYHELPYELEGKRDMSVESVYEYGSRAGIWRLFRIFNAHDIPVTIFGAAVALERNPQVAEHIRERGYEVAAHGYRWSNAFEMTRDEEREAIRLAVESITATTGKRPIGWYSREMSVNTREAARGRGRVPLRLRVLQRRHPVLDEDRGQGTPGRSLRPRRQRLQVRPLAGIRQPRAFP